MSQKAQDLKEQGADSQLLPGQEVKDQAPVHQQASPFAAAQLAKNAPGKLSPTQVLALQKSVGNQAVQRIMQSPSAVVQRHFSAAQLEAAEHALSDSMLNAHTGTQIGVNSDSHQQGHSVTLDANWDEPSGE